MHSFLKPFMPRVLLAAILTATFGAAPHAAVAASHPIPIAVARHLPLGTVVTVEGSVTVPSGQVSIRHHLRGPNSSGCWPST